MKSNHQGERKRKATPSASLLLGLVEDNAGHRLVPSHSQKQSKRYRYYISEPLNKTSRADQPSGIRIPAPELEGLVLSQLRDWINDEVALLKILDLDANQIQSAIKSIKQYQGLLNEDGKERYEFIRKLIERVSVLTDSIEIKINPNALYDDLAHPIEPITIYVQAKIERCGMAIRLMVGNKTVQQTPDQVLINSIRKAQDWLEKLTSGKVTSVGDLAKQEGMTSSAVTRLIYRAFLAPEIVRSIMNGTQPATLNSDLLKTIVPMPLDWNEQRKLLGFK